MSLQPSPSEAAQELLDRRAARATFTEYCRYVAPEEPPDRHHDLLCRALDKVASGELKRLMIFMPPGCAKSTYATVRFPAYYLGRNKQHGVITASHTDELAKHFGGKVRNLIAGQLARNVFGLKLTQDTRAKDEWNTEDGGFYLSAGVGGAIAGRRGDLLIADDLIKGRQAADSVPERNRVWNWWVADFRSRGKKGYSMVLIMTRWHEDDVAGRILPETWNGESGPVVDRNGETWEVICLPAKAREDDMLGRAPGEYLWPEYFDREHWSMAEVIQGPRNWMSLYQQVPSTEDGLHFKREWIRHYTQLPDQLTYYMSGDYAVTDDDGDFTEIAVWGVDSARNVYVVDWWSGQKTADVWCGELLDRAKRWRAVRHAGESGVIRRAVEPMLRAMMKDRGVFIACEWTATSTNKVAESATFQGLCAAGHVYWPHTSWAEEVIDQLMRFPAGRRDDKVDACSRFGNFIHKTWKPPAAAPPQPKPEHPTIAEMMAADVVRDDY